MVGYFLPVPCVYADELYHDFIFPIVIGYLLSYIFYTLTVLIPANNRKQKVRKNRDLIEYEIYSKLFFVFNTICDNTIYQRKHWSTDSYPQAGDKPLKKMLIF